MTEHAHPRPYGKIFLSLFVLTILEIFAAKLYLPKTFTVLLLVSMAILKAGLVAMFYMHLKFEKILLTVIAFSPLLFSVIMVSMVGWDIGKGH